MHGRLSHEQTWGSAIDAYDSKDDRAHTTAGNGRRSAPVGFGFSLHLSSTLSAAPHVDNDVAPLSPCGDAPLGGYSSDVAMEGGGSNPSTPPHRTLSAPRHHHGSR